MLRKDILFGVQSRKLVRSGSGTCTQPTLELITCTGVVSIGTIDPERALNAFKANATRQMKEDGCWREDRSPWLIKGSKRSLWNERSIARAIDYVLNGQGHELPDFDDVNFLLT